MSEHALHLPAAPLGAPASALAIDVAVDVTADVASVHVMPLASITDGELSEDDLEHVVGGLARAWFTGGQPAAGGLLS